MDGWQEGREGREEMRWILNALKDPSRTSTEGERDVQNHAFGALLSHPQYCRGHR